MTTLADILNAVEDLRDDIQAAIPGLIIGGNQILVPGGLSDITTNLGVVQAGEFRVGNGQLPGNGFSGVRMAYPAVTYNSEDWHIAGVESDALQFGLRSSDGVALAGAGAVVMDSNGIGIAIGTGNPNAVRWTGFTNGFASSKIYSVEDGANDVPLIDVFAQDTGGDEARSQLTTNSGIAGVSISLGLVADDNGTSYWWTNANGILGINYSGSAPFPDGLLHIYSGSAGTVAANAQADELILENSVDVGMTFLSPNNDEAYINFGDPDDNNVGMIRYDHNTDGLIFRAGGLDRGFFVAGFVVGSPTGGDAGAGTINVATDVLKNNSAYTNPDYALEHWATGRIEYFEGAPGSEDYDRLDLDDLESFIRNNYHLPRISRETSGIFERGDMLLEKVEEAFTYIIELHQRLKKLEG